jgi:threonine/homoserine/homoserine lactone efflux protein
MKALLAGVALGAAAGFSPGPLLALVISATVQRGFGAGTRVAMAPLVTDAPIIAVTALAVGLLTEGVLTGLAVGGAAYLFWLGTRTVLHSRSVALPGPGQAVAGRDLRRGVIANLLNPHPWLFWVTVGVPILVTAWDRSPIDGIVFLAGFYVLLVGSKVAIAALVAAGRRRMTPRWYRLAVLASGIILLLAGLLLLWEALSG